MTSKSRKDQAGRCWQVGLAAALLVSTSPAALRAETSNAELAKEIAELKAQIREMKGAMAQNRAETRRTSERVRAVSSRAPAVAAAPVAIPASQRIPDGATPAFVTADKKFQFGSITITPGGFLAGESVFRSKNLQADMISPFNNIPFNNNTLGHTREFRPSARQTRIALLAEAPITPTFLAAGYMEFDFMAAAPLANENITNSYQPRIRNLYAQLDNSDYGMHVLAGQNWSLLTLNSKGITPRNEVTPTVIDSSQAVGSLYARQAQIRLTKDFDRKLWLALSVEESQTTLGNGCPQPAAVGAVGQVTVNGNVASCNALGQGGSFAGQFGQAYSLNHVPDVVGKVAYEARLADRDVHLEGFGVYTNLYDRVLNGATQISSNKNTSGWGAGGGLITALIPKRLDFQINGIYGRGINRYGAAGLTEATFNGDASLRPIEGYIALAGLTLHATPSIDFYGYAGIEGAKRTYLANGAGGFVGSGSPLTNNTGCFTEGSANCTGNTKMIYEVTGGFWDKLYKGSFGEVRAGAQYAYVNRQIFNAPGLGKGPSTSDHIVMTSFRYYPFQ